MKSFYQMKVALQKEEKKGILFRKNVRQIPFMLGNRFGFINVFENLF